MGFEQGGAGMRITYVFYSVKDYSDIQYGEWLLEIFEKYGLHIEKVGEFEPIRKTFVPKDFPKLWRVDKTTGLPSSFSLLFRGKSEVSFSAQVISNVNLFNHGQHLFCFNGMSLWLTVKKSYDFEKLISLGDELFSWSEGVYGYITEINNDPDFVVGSGDKLPKGWEDIDYLMHRSFDISPEGWKMSRGNIGMAGIPDLLWVNYFGKPYLAEKDFQLPDDCVTVSHGVRFRLTEKPIDERLSTPTFLQQHKDIFGNGWFRQISGVSKVRLPYFDRSEITML